MDTYTRYLQHSLHRQIQRQTFVLNFPVLDPDSWDEVFSSHDRAAHLEAEGQHHVRSFIQEIMHSKYPCLRQEASAVRILDCLGHILLSDGGFKAIQDAIAHRKIYAEVLVQNKLRALGRYAAVGSAPLYFVYGGHVLFHLGLLGLQSGAAAVKLWVEENLGPMIDLLVEVDAAQ